MFVIFLKNEIKQFFPALNHQRNKIYGYYIQIIFNLLFLQKSQEIGKTAWYLNVVHVLSPDGVISFLFFKYVQVWWNGELAILF